EAGEVVRELRDLGGRGIDRFADAGQREIDLAGRAVRAAMELAAEDEACAHARTYREEDEVGDPSGDALPALAKRGQVDVVLERHREIEGSLQLAGEAAPLEASHVLREAQRPVGRHD